MIFSKNQKMNGTDFALLNIQFTGQTFICAANRELVNFKIKIIFIQKLKLTKQ